MLEFIWNRKKLAALVLVMLLGGGLYGGNRLLGADGGKSAEWTTLNEEINGVLTRNDGGSPSVVKDSAQARGPDHQASGAVAPNSNSGTGNTAEKREEVKGQEQKNAASGTEAGKPGTGGSGSQSGNGNRQQAGNPSGSKSSHGLIDINSASVSRLTDLPGIGESKARAIVEYRKQSGGFRSPEDLMKVKGIGEKTFDKLKDRITVSP